MDDLEIFPKDDGIEPYLLLDSMFHGIGCHFFKMLMIPTMNG
jgi:hypothetical protein